MDLNEGIGTMSMDGTCGTRAPLPGLSDEDRRRVYFYSVFPNFMIAPHPDLRAHAHAVAGGPEPHAHRVRVAGRSTGEGRPGFDLSGATDFWDLTNRQDWHVCELAQAGISSRGYRPGPYSNREDLLYAFDQFVLDKLGEPQS